METIDYKNFLDVDSQNHNKKHTKARVLDVDSNNSKALVETITGSIRLKLNNKTGELLSVGDYVVVEYDKMLTKKNAYISFRNGQANPATKSNIENAIVIQEKDVSYLLHEYTVVDYIAGNKIAYGGVTNPIIVNGYKVNVNGDHTSDLYSEMQFGVVWFNHSIYLNSKFCFTVTEFSNDGTTVWFKHVNNAGQTINSKSYKTKDLSKTGIKVEYTSICPPNLDGDFPNGYIKGYVYVCYVDVDTGVLYHSLFSTATIFKIGFASETEYHAAVGLTYEPITLSQVNETITEV